MLGGILGSQNHQRKLRKVGAQLAHYGRCTVVRCPLIDQHHIDRLGMPAAQDIHRLIDVMRPDHAPAGPRRDRLDEATLRGFVVDQ